MHSIYVQEQYKNGSFFSNSYIYILTATKQLGKSWIALLSLPSQSHHPTTTTRPTLPTTATHTVSTLPSKTNISAKRAPNPNPTEEYDHWVPPHWSTHTIWSVKLRHPMSGHRPPNQNATTASSLVETGCLQISRTLKAITSAQGALLQ